MAMTPEQQSAYVAQQMSQFQAVQDQVTSKCSRTKASSPSSQYLMPPRAGLLQNHPSPEMIPPTRHQSHESVGMISPTLGKQQGIFNSSPPFPIPSPSGHTPLGSLGSICQHRQIPEAVPGFCPSPLGSQPLSPHQLRQPSVPRMPTVFNNAAWVAAAAAATPAVLRAPPPSQAANGIHQHFDNNSIFAKAPMRAPLGAPAFPSHQAGVPPSQVAPGGRPGPKVSAAPAKPSFSLLGTQNLRQSPVWGPVPMLNATKSLHESMASFGPMSPIRGIKLPIYMAAAATAATASTIATSQCPGPVDRMGSPPGLPPCGIWSQPPLNDLISPPDCSEVDFTEAGSKGPRGSPEEDWVCNLRLIDDILEQHAAARNAAARSTGHIAPSAGEL